METGYFKNTAKAVCTRGQYLMNRLKPFYEITVKLAELLDQDINAKNRETIISQVNLLIEKRGDLLPEVPPPFTEDEKRVGSDIVLLNNKIQQKMNALFIDLKREMKQFKKQKKSNKIYTNPYEKIQTMDGMFLDNKK